MSISDRFKKFNHKRHALREELKHDSIKFALYKLGVIFVGSVIILAGIIMLVVPGPGLITIFAGLSILATEIPWANRIVRITRLQVRILVLHFKNKRKNKQVQKV